MVALFIFKNILNIIVYIVININFDFKINIKHEFPDSIIRKGT